MRELFFLILNTIRNGKLGFGNGEVIVCVLRNGLFFFLSAFPDDKTNRGLWGKFRMCRNV